MKKLVLALGLLAAGAAPARAGIYYDLQQTASSATLRMVGAVKMYASSFGGSAVLAIDAVGNTFTTSLPASFTATGNTTYSVSTSSGINTTAGGHYAPFFSATGAGFFGSLTGTASLATLATTATNVASGLAGSLVYQTGAGATTTLPIGTNGQILRTNTGATAPAWSSYLPETVTISTANVTPGFNAASRFMQFNASNQYPVADGSLITGITGAIAGLTSGKSVYASAANTLAAGPESVTSTSVTFPSGTTQGMAGNSTLAFTQVGTTAGSTITVASPAICSGCWVTIASTFPVQGISGVTFAGLGSSTTLQTGMYRIIYNGAVVTTVTDIVARFNGDSANHRWTTACAEDSATNANGSGAAAQCEIAGLTTGNPVGIGQSFDGEFIFGNLTANKTIGRFHDSFEGPSATDYFGCQGLCKYNGTATLSTVRIEAGVVGGLLQGAIILQQLGK